MGLLSIVVVWLIGVLIGCGGPAQPQPTATVPAATPAPQGQGYPAPAVTQGAYPSPINQPYPSPDQTPPAATTTPPPPVIIPTPSSGSAVIHGKLYNAQTDEPLYEGVIIYLSPVNPTDNPDLSALTFDPLSDRSTLPDAQGVFAFGDVPPGRYGIVVQAPVGKYLTRFANDLEKDVVITVEAGQTVDVGKIVSGYP